MKERFGLTILPKIHQGVDAYFTYWRPHKDEVASGGSVLR